MNILITGANGQLGNEMRTQAQKSQHHYVFTDVAELDITDAAAVEAMVEREKINVIVNCAAYTNVDKAETDEAFAHTLNCTAAENLARAAHKNGATLVHVSTDYVFDGTHCTPYSPDEPAAPASAYGRTKWAGEEAVRHSGCNHIILRTAWLYSPYGKNFVKTMQRLTAEKETLNVVVDQVGSPTYAADLAALIQHIIDTDQLSKCGTYHFSNQGVCSWFDFATAICQLSGNTCDVRPCSSDEFPSPVKRPHYSVLDKSLTEKTFGYKIPHWFDGLQRCLEAMKG